MSTSKKQRIFEHDSHPRHAFQVQNGVQIEFQTVVSPMLNKEMVVNLPLLPGVYFFRSKSGNILYIGKATSLRKRVGSYLHNRRHHPKVKRLIRHATQIDYEVCGSELEALLLESYLIKEHQPPYNTTLKFNRPSWFIRIDPNDRFPKIDLVLEIVPDGARYWGPFSSRRWTEEAIDILHKIFPIRTCEGEITPQLAFRPCFSYHVRRCGAPCAARVSQTAYHVMIDNVSRLLDGEHHHVLNELTNQRNRAVDKLQFERAKTIQKRIERIQKVFVYLNVHRIEVNTSI